MEQTTINEQPQTTEQQPETSTPPKKRRRKWELKTIEWLQIALDYNLFRYGGKGNILK